MIAIVTGGTGTLGSVVTERFLAAGASVALPLRTKESEQKLTATLRSSGRVMTAVADLKNEHSVRGFVDSVVERFGAISVLANIAGGYAGGRTIAEMSVEEWEEMMMLNLSTAFLMCNAVLPVMRKNASGRIINIAAMPALRSGAGRGAYATSKRGVISLTEIIADEMKETGITANAIAPGMIMSADADASADDRIRRKYVMPDEIANVILFLCSKEGRSVNGSVIKMFGTL